MVVYIYIWVWIGPTKNYGVVKTSIIHPLIKWNPVDLDIQTYFMYTK